jgi:hypothetical protein
VRGIKRNLPVRSLMPPVASLHSSNPPVCGADTLCNENAYNNDQVTHPLTTHIANDLECTRTPANSQPPSTAELTTISFGQRCGCGTGFEGEDGVVVVFEGLLGMAKGDWLLE